MVIIVLPLITTRRNKTKASSDLNINWSHQFIWASERATDRFVIHFSPIVEEEVNLAVVVFYDGSEINFDLTAIADQTDI
jgi:hypothetical protein